MESNDDDLFLTLGLSQPETRPDVPGRRVEWEPEPELCGPVPRKVVLKDGVIKEYYSGPFFGLWLFFLLFGALLFFASVEDSNKLGMWGSPLFFGGIALFLLFVRDRKRRISKLLVARGRATRGVVVDEWEAHYKTPDGSKLELTLESSAWAIGDVLTILHLPEAPERAMAYTECDYKVAPIQKKSRTYSLPVTPFSQ